MTTPLDPHDPFAPAPSSAAAGPAAPLRAPDRPAPPAAYAVQLDVGDVTATTFRLWWDNLGPLVGAMMLPLLVVAAPLGAAFFLFSVPVGSGEGGLSALTIAGIVAAVGIILVASMASVGAVFHFLNERVQGTAIGIGEALTAGLRSAGSLFGVWFAQMTLLAIPMAPLFLTRLVDNTLTASSFVVGAVGFVIAAYVLLRLAPAMAAVVAEERGPLSALGRAWQLTRGRALRVLAAALVFGLASFAIGMGITIVSIVPLLGLVVGVVGNVITAPLAYVFLFVLYAACVRDESAGR